MCGQLPGGRMSPAGYWEPPKSPREWRVTHIPLCVTPVCVSGPSLLVSIVFPEGSLGCPCTGALGGGGVIIRSAPHPPLLSLEAREVLFTVWGQGEFLGLATAAPALPLLVFCTWGKGPSPSLLLYYPVGGTREPLPHTTVHKTDPL